jgi:hypothetical protein
MIIISLKLDLGRKYYYEKESNKYFFIICARYYLYRNATNAPTGSHNFLFSFTFACRKDFLSKVKGIGSILFLKNSLKRIVQKKTITINYEV